MSSNNALRGDRLLPLLLLKEPALRHNIELMARYCAERSISLAPHGKTTMAPKLVSMQFEAGAWGVTVANVTQARVFRSAGVSTILVANEVLEPLAISWAVREIEAGARILCLADSLEGVAIMGEAVLAAGAQAELEVLVELGFAGGRTGCRSVETAIAVAEAIADAPGLRLAGAECYEGTMHGEALPETLPRVDRLLDELRGLIEALDRRGRFGPAAEIIVSAGGSVYFDRVAERLGPPWRLSRPVRLVLRSGCYVTHDSGFYERLSPLGRRGREGNRLRPALEAWGVVLSRPEPDLAIVGFGKRDVPYDLDLPLPLYVCHRGADPEPLAARPVVESLNDQHAYVRGEVDELGVGDWLGCGISHPCTAFDKWRSIPLVDDEYNIVDEIETFF